MPDSRASAPLPTPTAASVVTLATARALLTPLERLVVRTVRPLELRFATSPANRVSLGSDRKRTARTNPWSSHVPAGFTTRSRGRGPIAPNQSGWGFCGRTQARHQHRPVNTMTNTAELTDADWTARARAPYLDARATEARLARCATVRETLTRARWMLQIARNPGFRFGLTREDVPAEVVATLVAAIEAAEEKARPLAVRMREVYAEYLAWDTTWGILDEGARELGFGYGDSALLESVL